LQKQGLANFDDEFVHPVSGRCYLWPEPTASFGGALSISTCPRDLGIALASIHISKHTWRHLTLRHAAAVANEINITAYYFCNASCTHAILVPGSDRALGSLEVMLVLDIIERCFIASGNLM
jgi:hypothetical protein